MSGREQDQGEKSFEPTPEKLRQARQKGDVAKSMDLSVAASYLGLLVALLTFGGGSILHSGSALMVFLDQPDQLVQTGFSATGVVKLRAAIRATVSGLAFWFIVPTAAVILSLLAQQAITFAPSKLAPRLSRISPIANAHQKYGRTGLFEFAKSFVKLVLFSACLAVFLQTNLPEILVLAGADPAFSTLQWAYLGLRFLALATVVALAIGAVDAVWQYTDLRRRNRMTRQNIQDETKSSEGDPHFKQARRQRGQEIARNQMLADVPRADVVLVNPTHYAVALTWSRTTGTAPVCVARGRDETAARIRETAIEAGVPVYRDPPTTRAIFATVSLGQEIQEDHYRAVAVAIRFAEDMRRKAKGRVL